MKYFTVVLALLVAADAFTVPPMATRAVGRKVAKPVKKAPPKKTATKPVAKKAAPKKAAPKKPAPKKVVAKKPAPKKPAPKKVVAKKPALQNPFARKPAPKKVVEKKPAPKKVVAKKPAPKNPFARKPAPKKTVAKKSASKTVAKKRTPPKSKKSYPSIGSSSVPKINVNIPKAKGVYSAPDFSDPRLQIKRDPAVWAAAAKTRETAFSNNQEFVYEDGLTVIEQRQRDTLPAFLTGSAKSQADKTTIRRIEGDTLLFGLDPDRFQLLFITIFGLFALVGSLSGTVTF